MNNPIYTLSYQELVDLSNIQGALYRIQFEGDEHSQAIAKDALALVVKIQDNAKRIDDEN